MFAELEAPPTSSQNPGGGVSALDSEEVVWEYKWQNSEEEEIHGPFTSTQMSDWVEQGYVGLRHYIQEYIL